MGGRGFESRQKRPKLKDENICILGDASFSHKKSIPDQKGARSSASISRVCPGRVGADPGTHQQSSWAPTSHVLVVNCEATKATISATIKAIPVHRYPLSPFEL